MYRSTRKLILLLLLPLIPFIALIAISVTGNEEWIYYLGWMVFFLVPLLILIFFGILFWYAVIIIAYRIDRKNEKMRVYYEQNDRDEAQDETL